LTEKTGWIPASQTVPTAVVSSAQSRKNRGASFGTANAVRLRSSEDETAWMTLGHRPTALPEQTKPHTAQVEGCNARMGYSL